MCIDVKKRSLVEEDEEELTGKRRRGSVEGSKAVTANIVDAGLSKQPGMDQ